MRVTSCRRVARALPATWVPVALAGCTGEGASIGGIAFVAVLLGALAAGLAYLLGRAHGATAVPQPAGAARAPSRPQASDATAPALEAPVPPEPSPGRNATEQDSYSFTLSHDLRAPLRVVEGFTRIVKEDYGAQLDRVGNDHLERVLGAAARMNLMIDALLALARLSQQPLSRQRVNLSQLAGFVVDDLRRGTSERVVDADIEAGLSVMGDPTLLRLVLENLLGNAWKYTAKSASPRVELRRESPAGAATLAFVVRDNGAGFDMRSADRLFGLFQRLHSASDFPGHGVGLASVRRIVERHGGRVWAESEPGRGAAFHVELPA
jgi:light-regulated signal transduction histidine kinase (bacteriophytochrome)